MKNLLLLLALLSINFSAYAQSDTSDGNATTAEVSTTEQQVTINGTIIPLIAEAGTFRLRDEDNEPIALFGYTSYTHKNGGSERPIVFAYNGGPGSSSFWLHMGVLGPKRIVVNDPDFTPASPYPLVNNEYSILDVADLVMIDPVGTGLSVAIGNAEFADFWGVDQDIRSISLFITQYLIAKDRMNSPKFLLGESYGTFRNAGVMKRLLSQGVAMNGVIMVSAVFDLRTLLFPPNEDMSYIAHFPTYAATAWYHKKADTQQTNLETYLDEVRTFTVEEYVPALFLGDQITEERKRAVADRLAAYSGLNPEYWLRADLRVNAGEYFQELLREEGKIVGRLDSRYTGVNEDLVSPTAYFDPQSRAISPAYITTFLDYFHRELGVRRDLQYTITAGRRKDFKWDWSHTGNIIWNANAAVSTAPDMATTLTQDPNMKVLILNGYYDLATVFYGVEHTIDHLGLPPALKDNIIMKYYEAGHMMYTHEPSLVKFKEDVVEFVRLCTE